MIDNLNNGLAELQGIADKQKEELLKELKTEPDSDLMDMKDDRYKIEKVTKVITDANALFSQGDLKGTVRKYKRAIKLLKELDQNYPGKVKQKLEDYSKFAKDLENKILFYLNQRRMFRT